MLSLKPGEHVTLETSDDGSQRVHVFDEATILAVETAWSAERVLLVKGEPGTGKSQLAEAVAHHCDWKWLEYVVDAQTEARDLLWRFDAVKRLADAQLLGALGSGRPVAGMSDDDRLHRLRDWLAPLLAEKNYVSPGPLWWAFNWEHAREQHQLARADSPYPTAPGDPSKGCVVLIDELDKAESDVPNGLLGPLGGAAFQPYGVDAPVRIGNPRPLIIVTTNEERPLPHAFVRRCVVHVLEVPDRIESDFMHYLVARGRLHFPGASEAVLTDAAQQLCRDRADAKRLQLRPYPGQAEYLDLLRAVLHQGKTVARQRELLKQVAPFVLQKYRGVET